MSRSVASLETSGIPDQELEGISQPIGHIEGEVDRSRSPQKASLTGSNQLLELVPVILRLSSSPRGIPTFEIIVRDDLRLATKTGVGAYVCQFERIAHHTEYVVERCADSELRKAWPW